MSTLSIPLSPANLLIVVLNRLAIAVSVSPLTASGTHDYNDISNQK